VFLLVDLVAFGVQRLLDLLLDCGGVSVRIITKPSDLLLIRPDPELDAVEFEEERSDNRMLFRLKPSKSKA
jgi:hypothetical protein